MEYRCKLCGEVMPLFRNFNGSLLTFTYCCGREYWLGFVIEYGGQISYERIEVANFELVFYHNSQQLARIFCRSNRERKLIGEIAMTELSPESAKHWQRKLKTYVTFQ